MKANELVLPDNLKKIVFPGLKLSNSWNNKSFIDIAHTVY